MSTPAPRLERTAEEVEVFAQGQQQLPTVEVEKMLPTTDRQETYTLIISPTGGISVQGPTVEQRFRELASKWISETAMFSDPIRKFMDRSHLKIIAMGPSILPLVLREVEKMSGHWFVVLDAISSVNPVRPSDQVSFEKTAQAWLDWGRREGLI